MHRCFRAAIFEVNGISVAFKPLTVSPSMIALLQVPRDSGGGFIALWHSEISGVPSGVPRRPRVTDVVLRSHLRYSRAASCRRISAHLFICRIPARPHTRPRCTRCVQPLKLLHFMYTCTCKIERGCFAHSGRTHKHAFSMAISSRRDGTEVPRALRDKTEHSFPAPRRYPGRGARGARYFSHGAAAASSSRLINRVGLVRGPR